MKLNHIILFGLLLCTLTFVSCRPESMTSAGPEWENFTGDDCFFNHNCQGVAVCNDGFCECPPGVMEIAPGLCLQSDNPAFVSFNQYEGLMDTMVLEFDVDPRSVRWENGDPVDKWLSGRVYKRNPTALSYTSFPFAIVTFPGRRRLPTDSIWIVRPVADGTGEWFRGPNNWGCPKTIAGRFIDDDTFEGILRFGECRPGRDSLPKPPIVQQLEDNPLPVTFRRVQ